MRALSQLGDGDAGRGEVLVDVVVDFLRRELLVKAEGAAELDHDLRVRQRFADRHALLPQGHNREPGVRLEPFWFRALEIGRRG